MDDFGQDRCSSSGPYEVYEGLEPAVLGVTPCTVGGVPGQLRSPLRVSSAEPESLLQKQRQRQRWPTTSALDRAGAR